MKNIIIGIIGLFLTNIMMAQQTPADAQKESILIKNATLHIGNGEVIENGVIAFDKGKITLIDDATTVKLDESTYGKVIDGSGKDIYPGFIAPNTQIGLIEIDAVRATRDNREVGGINPSVRSIISYNTDSRVTPTIRSNGILLAQVVPEGGRIPGQSSVVQLDAWNWEDAAYATDNGLHLNWPAPFYQTGWWAEPGGIEKNDEYGSTLDDIRKYIKEAKTYNDMTKPEKVNLKFEAMKGLFDGSKKLYIQVNFAKAIMEAVLLMEEFDITPVIVGGKDSWQITDFLKEHNVSIILSNVQSLPVREDDDIDQPYKTPKILSDAGVPFAFSMGGAWEQRNLIFQAGQAVAFGLDYEKAIEGLTLNTAKIMGIDDKTGSLEEGKDANFTVVEGDILDMRTCKVEDAYIQGRHIDISNKQKALAKKFSEKYGIEIEVKE